MTTFGVTPDGFNKKTFDDVFNGFVSDIRSVPGLSRLNLSRRSFWGGVVAVVAAGVTEGWDVLQAVYSAFDPDGATGRPLDNIAAYTGTRRLPATATLVRGEVDVDPGTYPAGSLIAAVTDHPERRFHNRDVVVNSTTANQNYDCVFVCETTGPIECPISSLFIASSFPGWTGVENFIEATLGLDEETDSELRTRRESEIAAEGGSTIDAMVADMERDSRIIKCSVFHNVSDDPMVISGSLMPPHSFEAVVFDGSLDGSALTDQAIGDRLWKSAPAGIHSVGTTLVSVLARDGQFHDLRFSRPEPVDIYLSVVITPGAGWGSASPANLKAAIVAYAQRHYTVGSSVLRAFLVAPITAFPGVANVPLTTLLIGLSLPGTAADVVLTNRQIPRFQTAHMTVNGV